MRRAKASERTAASATVGRRLPAVGPDLLLAIVVLCFGWDIFRLGFFSDDLHLLDVARRKPLGDLLTGQYGIWPWYRPLSRELFFWLLVQAGPWTAPLAHVAGLLGLWAAGGAVWRLAERLVAAPAAAVAPVLFVTYQYTKFVTGWASGFQDLLAIVLTLWAVVHHARGKRWVAVAFAGLAPFAKETGFLAAPLVLAWAFLVDGERRMRAWMLGHAAAMAIAAAAHVWARSTWAAASTRVPSGQSPLELLHTLGQIAGAFLTTPRVEAGLSLALALVAAACVAMLVGGGPRAAPDPRGRTGWFLAAACAASLAPVVAGHVLGYVARAYHAFPAIPWISLAVARLARRAPAWALRAILPALAAVNIWGLAFQRAPANDPSTWSFGQWDWFEAVRLSEATRHLDREVRSAIPTHPESLVVVYAETPWGSRYQTEDGPATREALRDPTVRAYSISTLPIRVKPGRVVLLAYDNRHQNYIRIGRDYRTNLREGALALLRNRPYLAFAFTMNADSVHRSSFQLAYLQAASLLTTDGPDAYVRTLAAAGYADTLGRMPLDMTAGIRRQAAGLANAYEGLLRRPRFAPAHAALAESLRARNNPLECGMSLRVAALLDPGRLEDRLQLAKILTALGEKKAARLELEAVARGEAPAQAARAREELDRLGP